MGAFEMEAAHGAASPGRAGLTRATEVLAGVGGVLLLAGMATTVASVVQAQFGRPILGDTEIVEMTTGVAVACFLPYAQMRGANVIIDFFTQWASQRMRDLLDAAMAVLFALVAMVLTWRLAHGGVDAYTRRRASMFLELPDWWGYLGATIACLVWVAVCLFTAVEAAKRSRASVEAV